MKKYLVVVLSAVVLFSITPVVAQAESVATSRPNAVSFEGLGRGFLYSLNYDRSITDRIGVGGGFSVFGLSGANVFVVPLYGNYYFYTPASHRIFATAGIDIIRVSVTVGSLSLSGSGVAGTMGGGYEYRGESGFLFRAAPYLFIPLGTGGSVLPYVGLSAGYAF